MLSSIFSLEKHIRITIYCSLYAAEVSALICFEAEDQMRIVFVRHGEPDYSRDCLTETGKRQAAAAAKRLVREGISSIYASPMGRASQTAAYTAQELGLPVQTLDYMHEISWGGPGIPEEGHPWTLSDWMISLEDFDFYHHDWREHPYFKGNAAVQYYDDIAEQFDQFLLAQGYRHEGSRYFCTTDENRTIALFSHGGSGACVLSHLLSLPFPYVCTVLPYEFTSIIILEFPVQPGQYVHPRIELFNDTAHTLDISSGLVFQQTVD